MADGARQDQVKSRITALRLRALQARASAAAEAEAEFESARTRALELVGQVPALQDIPQGPDMFTLQDLDSYYRLDRERGAPAIVRAYVGSVYNPDDRLATLQNFYPDAAPYGDDNFVFTDPKTGQPTLFNPEGLDFGDVAGAGREISQLAFSAGGAFLGGTTGTVAGLPTGPGAVATGGYGASIGAGIGNVVGGELFDIGLNWIGNMRGDPYRVDRRNLAKRATDITIDFLGAGIGQRTGELIEQGTKRLLAGSSSNANQLLTKFQSFSITPTAGQVTGSRTMQTVETALEASPGGGAWMQKVAQNAVENTKKAVGNLLTRMSTSGRFLADDASDAALGSRVRGAAVGAMGRANEKFEQVYNDVFEEIGADTRIFSLQAITDLRQELLNKLSQAPESLGPTIAPTLQQIENLLTDALRSARINRLAPESATVANLGIPFGALRQIRTDIGKNIAEPFTSGATSAQNVLQKRLYAALTEDMTTAVGDVSESALRRLQVADRAFRIWKNTAGATFEKMAKMDVDEKVWQTVVTASRDNARGLARMRRYFTDAEWDDVSANILYRLGQSRPGSQNADGSAFSVATYMTRWNKGPGGLSPEAKDILFNNTRYGDLRKQLDRLADVISAMKGAEAVANRSNTARTLITYNLIAALGGAGGAVVSGDLAGGAAGASSTIVTAVLAPRLAAKLLTSSAFVQWLSSPVTRANSISAHMSRLFAIAEADPELREAIAAFAETLRDPSQQGGNP